MARSYLDPYGLQESALNYQRGRALAKPQCPEHGDRYVYRDIAHFTWLCGGSVVKVNWREVVAEYSLDPYHVPEPDVTFEKSQCDWTLDGKRWQEMLDGREMVSGRGMSVNVVGSPQVLDDIYQAQYELAEKIRSTPNMMVVSPSAGNALKMNPDLWKHSNSSDLNLFGMEVHIDPSVPEGKAFVVSVPEKELESVRPTSELLNPFVEPIPSIDKEQTYGKGAPKTEVALLRERVEKVQKIGREALAV